MGTRLHLASLFVLAALLLGCSGSNEREQALLAQIDSLQQEANIQQKDKNNLQSLVSFIAESMDSIALQEGLLLTNHGQENGAVVSKQQLKENLKAFQEIIERQRQRLNDMQEQLEAAHDSMAVNMQKLIAFYKTQLDAKDATIAQLQQDLERKNVSISQLTQRVGGLTAHNQQLQQQVEEQEEVMQVQDNMLSLGYVQIGTRKELQAKGLLSGTLLQKKKVNTAQLNPSNFMQVDIRQFNDISLQSKAPKILTQMPASSYALVPNGDGTVTLHINSPSDFWSVSNYLIIQL